MTEMFLYASYLFLPGTSSDFVRGTIRIVSKRHLLHDMIDELSAPHDDCAPVVERQG